MEQQETKDQKKKKSRKWLWAIVIAAGLIVLVLLFLPSILSTSGGTEFLEGRISSAVDGDVKMGNLSVGWLSGIKVDNFVFEGPQGATRVQAEKITSRPRLWRLITGRLALEDTVIDKPDVQLTVTQEGRIKGLEDEEKEEKEERPTKKMEIGPLELKVNDGRAVIRQAMGDSQYRQVELRNIASTVNLQGGASSLALSMAVASNGQEGAVEALSLIHI
jgi:hypothetical protein